jgi:hypothetical protein
MKFQVLNLVQQLSNGQADATVSERLYREVIFDLGRDEWLSTFTLVPLTSAGSSVQMPVQIIKTLAMFYDDEQLGEMTLKQAQYLNDNWRDQPGVPHSYVFDGETRKNFRLDPYPMVASKPFIFIHGSPLGQDFPAYAVAIAAIETRVNVLFQMEIAVALLVLEKEFERESDHKDDAFAQAAGQMGRIFLEMVKP